MPSLYRNLPAELLNLPAELLNPPKRPRNGPLGSIWREKSRKVEKSRDFGVEFKDVYQEKELGQLVQRRCTETINSGVNTLKFRGALKVLTPELIL